MKQATLFSIHLLLILTIKPMTSLVILLNQAPQETDLAKFVDGLALALSYLFFFLLYLIIFCCALYCLHLICSYFIGKNKRDYAKTLKDKAQEKSEPEKNSTEKYIRETVQKITQENQQLYEKEREKTEKKKLKDERESIRVFTYFFTTATIFFIVTTTLFNAFYLEKEFQLSEKAFLLIGMLACNYILLNIQKIEEKIQDFLIFAMLGVFITIEALAIVIKQDMLFYFRILAGILVIIYGLAILYCFVKNYRLNKKALQ